MTIIETPSWILKDKTDQPVASGQTVTSFRGDKAIVTGGRPPLTEESTGRVVVAGVEYYPSVFDLKWVRK